jgi:hypothetical protein
MIELSDRLLANRPLTPVVFDAPIPLADVPTPALLLDEDALDRNIARMADFLQCGKASVRTRRRNKVRKRSDNWRPRGRYLRRESVRGDRAGTRRHRPILVTHR